MKCILVMEEAFLGEVIKGYLEKNGYKVILASEQYEAMAIMGGKRRIDFVLSAGIGWESCDEFAFTKYDFSNVIILTTSTEIVREMKSRGVVAFEKPTSYDVLVASIIKACPP